MASTSTDTTRRCLPHLSDPRVERPPTKSPPFPLPLPSPIPLLLLLLDPQLLPSQTRSIHGMFPSLFGIGRTQLQILVIWDYLIRMERTRVASFGRGVIGLVDRERGMRKKKRKRGDKVWDWVRRLMGIKRMVHVSHIDLLLSASHNCELTQRG